MADAVIEANQGETVRRRIADGESRRAESEEFAATEELIKPLYKQNISGGNEQWLLQQHMVKELREMTGAGMMDCKKALT